ncbi:hypothetical protein LWI29_019529 [Acer saccharum]|uniref:Retrovirus-related Pol polyprotein from transposon TNT 1-94-like beta-barrel domain-containing protein n=1 Tax=Acer saccharum TaxID=4024 RepID=A0AA39RWP6_ACESA|nr:hypothetical protein LWI29_019529 [Acer saccharum]
MNSLTENANSMAFSVRNDAMKFNTNKSSNKTQKKERPICTHCGYPGHTIEKCYKLHGYPPGYKPKQRNSSSNQVMAAFPSQASINQVSATESEQVSQQRNFGNFVQMLNPPQYQHLMSMLTAQMNAASKPQMDTGSPSTSYATGICLSVSFNPILASSHYWIIDSGATSHICSTYSVFSSLKPITNSFVTLPNHTKIPVFFIGTVQISPSLLLTDVLFVPQFKFNLLSVSALTSSSQLSVSFFTDSCVVQDINSMRMIGKGKKLESLYVLDANLPLASVSSPESCTPAVHLHDANCKPSVSSMVNNVASHFCELALFEMICGWVYVEEKFSS